MAEIIQQIFCDPPIVIARLGAIGEKINYAIDSAAKMFFGIIRIIVRVAPIGAFGAMAFTIGAYGLGSLINLLQLVATFYFLIHGGGLYSLDHLIGREF